MSAVTGFDGATPSPSRLPCGISQRSAVAVRCKEAPAWRLFIGIERCYKYQEHRKKLLCSISSVINRSAWDDMIYHIAKTSVFTDLPADGKVGL